MHQNGLSAGFLYPGHSAEDDYPAIERAIGGVRLPVVHTLMREDAHRVDALLDVGGADVLGRGRRASCARIGAGVGRCGRARAAASCSAGTARRGRSRGVREAAGVPASSTSFAFVNAARALGVTPGRGRRDLPRRRRRACSSSSSRDAGIEVVALSSRGIVTAAEVGTLGRDEVLAFVAANDHPDAEARAGARHRTAHRRLARRRWRSGVGKPVLTANQVSVWEGLRLASGAAGLPPRTGLGPLFAAPAAVPAGVAEQERVPGSYEERGPAAWADWVSSNLSPASRPSRSSRRAALGDHVRVSWTPAPQLGEADLASTAGHQPRPAARGHAAARPGGPAAQRTAPRPFRDHPGRGGRRGRLPRPARHRAGGVPADHGAQPRRGRRPAHRRARRPGRGRRQARPGRDERRRPGVPRGAGQLVRQPPAGAHGAAPCWSRPACASTRCRTPTPSRPSCRGAPAARRRDRRRRGGAAAAASSRST